MTENESTLMKMVETLPFVENHSIEISKASRGECIARMPFHSENSTPPGFFPASIVGMLGDVAGITACISALEPGRLRSTLDFTVKMTGTADGDILEAYGKALNAGKSVITGEAKIYSVKNETKKLCAAVLVTGRVIN